MCARNSAKMLISIKHLFLRNLLPSFCTSHCATKGALIVLLTTGILSGCGVASKVATSGTGIGSVTIGPPSLSFGSVSEGSSSASQTITVSNTTSSSVALSPVSITGTNASNFSISSTTCGSSLAASASCTAAMVFTPSVTGAESATFNITSSNNSAALTASLSGTGTAASAGTVTVSPTSVTWGSVAVGNAGGQMSVTLTNSSSSAITISSIGVTGADPGDFSIYQNSCGTSLAASSSCAVTILFEPTTSGTRTAALTFTDNAPSSPQTATLNGTGAAANGTGSTATLAIIPSSLSFASQSVGATSAPQSFTLTAGGSGTVSFTSMGFTGTDPGDFHIATNTCGTSLAAGSSCTVSVAFTPTAIANRVALFTVIDNATTTTNATTATTATQTAEVSGAGAYTAAQTAAITVDFGSRSGSQVSIPARMLGTEYLESLPTNANRATVVQGGFTAARYRLSMTTVFPTATPDWDLLDSNMEELQAAGVNPIIELTDDPSFLQPSSGGCPTAPATNVPSNVNTWGQLAAQIVGHLDATFPGFAQDYEIWNEPNTTALCSKNKDADYISIYAAAAPLMKAQAANDKVTIHIGGPAGAGVIFPDLLTNPSTAPYVDFYSYHRYLGTKEDTENGMTWDGTGGTPSLYQKILSGSGMLSYYLKAYKVVAAGNTPLGVKTPIYFDEYNDDWAFLPDCCRNSPIYSPLFNSMTVAEILNSAFNDATTEPSRMIYFAAGQKTFCILGIIDPAMDCAKAVTGAQAQPYPQWYTYRLMFAPSFLDLQDGGNMATSVTLSTSAKSDALIATAYYTATTDSILIINPTGNSYSGVTLQINNNGISSPQSTLYTINATNQLSSWPATVISVPGGLQLTFDLPSYTVLAVSLKQQ
jgi:hypothetical protein